MLIHLLESLRQRQATLALLCKTSTARKVLHYAWQTNARIAGASLHTIDTMTHFGAAVEACFLIMHMNTEINPEDKATLYADLKFEQPLYTFGIRQGELVSDVVAFDRIAHLEGIEYRHWRSGVKHDAARLMELEPVLDGYRNGLGETWALEENYLYPLLKSSDLANDRLTPRRYILLPQRLITDDTAGIEKYAPNTWQYLVAHGNLLDARASSIYKSRPRFSVFGTGEYTFSPWKVAVSGLHTPPKFRVIGSHGGKTIVLDDTCYFIPCQSHEEALFLAYVLNSDLAKSFLQALIFFDAKRPVTIEVLRRIDLFKLALQLGAKDQAQLILAHSPFEKTAQQRLLFA